MALRDFFLVSLTLLWAQSGFAGQELSMADLQALNKQGGWSEILKKADAVKPAARTPEWNSIVSGAAVHELDDVPGAITNNEQMAKIQGTILNSEAKYAFVLKDTAYIQAKGKVLTNVAQACTDRPSYGCGDFIEALSRGVTSYPKGTSKKIAMLMAKDGVSMPSLSIYFWKTAVTEDAADCDNGALERAVMGALNSPDKGAMAVAGKDALKICISKMEKSVMDRLGTSEAGSDFAKNACEIVAKRDKYTMLKKQKCKI